MEPMEEPHGICATPPGEPVPEAIRELAGRFLEEAFAARRLVNPPLAHLDGHGLRLEDAGRGCIGPLGVLSDEGGCASPSLFARQLGLTPARVSNILSALEREGLVERGPSAGDRRRVEVRLTEKGREVDAHMNEALARRTADLLNALGEEDSRELVRILGRIVAVLGDAQWQQAQRQQAQQRQGRCGS